jgi:hypothetical protein
MSQNMLTTLNMIFGSNHGQAYVKSVLVYYNHSFLVKHLKVVAKCCLNW